MVKKKANCWNSELLWKWSIQYSWRTGFHSTFLARQQTAPEIYHPLALIYIFRKEKKTKENKKEKKTVFANIGLTVVKEWLWNIQISLQWCFRAKCGKIGLLFSECTTLESEQGREQWAKNLALFLQNKPRELGFTVNCW